MPKIHLEIELSKSAFYKFYNTPHAFHPLNVCTCMYVCNKLFEIMISNKEDGICKKSNFRDLLPYKYVLFKDKEIHSRPEN